MSNLSLVLGSRIETLGAGTGTGTSVTANSTPNVKGASWTQIGSATSFDYNEVFLSIALGGTVVGRVRFDLGVVTSGGSTQIIAADLFMDFSTVASHADFVLPVNIPKGATLWGRCQSNTASVVLSVVINGIQGQGRMMRGCRGIASCTDWTNTDPTNTATLNGTTFTSWVQIQSSTAQRIGGLIVAIDGKGATLTSANVLFQVGWGSAGNERTLFQFAVRMAGAINVPPAVGPIPCDLPSGTRLAFRAQASAADTNVLGLALMGLIA